MLSENIKKMRTDKKISRRRFAKMVGKTTRAIEKIEFGRTKNPRIDTLQKIATALDTTLEELLK